MLEHHSNASSERNQPGVVERVGESDQTFDVIWSFFPILRVFAGSAQPAAIGTETRDHLLGVTGETITLQLQFPEQPTRGAHAAQRQRDEWSGAERLAIRNGWGKMRICKSRSNGGDAQEQAEGGAVELILHGKRFVQLQSEHRY